MDGYLQKHVRKLIREYKEKYLYFHSILEKNGIQPVYLDETYMTYWVEYNRDEEKLINACKKCSIGLTMQNGLIGLSFASIEKELMEAGVIRLAQILKEC